MTKRLLSSPLLALPACLSVLFVACADKVPVPAVPTPAGTPTVARPAPAPTTTAPEPTVPAPTPTVPAPDAAPPPLAEPLPPLARGFTLVPAPAIKDAIGAIAGRSATDLWLLSRETTYFYERPESGTVYHYDGKRFKSYGHPCEAANWWDIAVGKDTVVAVGYRAWSRGVYPLFRGVMSPNGKWTCDYRDMGFRSGMTLEGGGRVWELSCDQMNGCRFGVAGGEPVPFPSFHGVVETDPENTPPPYKALRMTGSDDGWLVHQGDDGRDWLFRFNGVAWTALAPLAEDMTALGVWGYSEGAAWIPIRTTATEDDPANALLRWDGHTLAHVAVPASFKVRFVRGTGPRDVWFFGDERRIYHFDGEKLHQGKAPFDVHDAWAAEGGDLWIVGGSDGKPDGPQIAGLGHTGLLQGAAK